MQLNILSQNLTLYICILFTSLTAYILLSLYVFDKTKPKKSKKKKKSAKLDFSKPLTLDDLRAYLKFAWVQIGLGLLISLVLAVSLDVLVTHATQTNLPASFILMCLPFTLLISLFGLTLIAKRRLRIVTGVTVLVSLIFSLLIINDYYRYAPTIGNLLGKTNATAFAANTANVTVNYTIGANQQVYNNSSIQASLAKIKSAPTAGKVYQVNIPGTVSKFNARPGYVYVPAIYNSPAQVNLPVIVLTAGVPGLPANWLGLGLQQIMDNFAKSHDGITPLVFVADSLGSINNDTECVNSPRGNVETYLSVDVPNYIKKNFRVDDAPQNWAIGGLSLGGMCAIMLTLRHTNVYHYFIDLGGEIGPEVGSKSQTIAALFNGSEADWAAHQPSLLLQENKYKGIGGFFGDGNQDSLAVTSAIAKLSAESKKAGLDSVIETINGAHTFDVWGQTYKDSLPWISNRIGATQCTSNCI